MTMNLSSFLQWRFNICLYLTFGWSIAKIFVFLFGTCYFFLNRQEKERIKNAVSESIGRRDPGADIRAVTKKVFSGILSHYYEKLFIAFERPGKAAAFLTQSIDSRDLEILRKNSSKGKGVIVVTGHYGAIEYIPTLLAINGFSVSMIAKFKTEQLKEKVYSQARIYNIKLIDAESTRNVVAAAFNELKNNRILITQCDEIEEWKPSKRKKTSFLGRTTGLDRSINIIQKRTGAEVVFGIIHRYNLEAYKLIMCDYEQMLKSLGRQSDLSAGEAVLGFLEQCIYENPEQWYQWKKYLDIQTVPPSGERIEKSCHPFMLRPVFG
jgi:KDO2-lipid IV(A) lauroyltransferase